MMMDTEVLIVGAGPVGLTLAILLGQSGIKCVLVEKKPRPEFLPKMERCNSRTMEIFRRIGVADKIRKAGLDESVPMDVFIILAMNREPLLKLPYPSVAEMREQIASCSDGSMPLEPYQLISQYTLEPVLLDVARSLPSVDIRYGAEFVSLSQTAAGVTAVIEGEGGTRQVRARYLVGCDGGGSTVRRQLGIRLRGEGDILRLRQGLFYCEDLFERIPLGAGPGRGRHYHVADDRASFLIMQDSTKHWTLHAVVEDEAAMARQFEKVVGAPVKYEMLYVGEWKQNLLLADQYRHGNVFLAGDAAHLVIPTGGLGMNTGVGDAVDLAWKLEGTLRGWGGAGLLDSYAIERRQVGDRNVGASRYASIGRRRWRAAYTPEINDDTAAGYDARRKLTALADVEQRKTNEMIGAELGYRYIASPIVHDEPGGPEQSFRDYEPTTWPGARLPHMWLENGIAVQDLFQNGYTLLRVGPNAAGCDVVEEELRKLGAPCRTIHIPDERVRELYQRDLILIRPDLHVAWRGNTPPADAAELAALATGRRSTTNVQYWAA